MASVISGLTEPLAAGVLAAGRQAKWERERIVKSTTKEVNHEQNERHDVESR